jgi:hypothetical protein
MTERPSEKAAWPKTEEDLIAYIREMLKWPDGASEPGEGYGRCVYSMAYAAVATFNYVASTLGCTGFQASCADMQILRQTRDLEHGFMIVDANKLLFPQYDPMREVAKFLEERRPELAAVARQKIAEDDASNVKAHPNVRARWEEIAALVPPKKP